MSLQENFLPIAVGIRKKKNIFFLNLFSFIFTERFFKTLKIRLNLHGKIIICS